MDMLICPACDGFVPEVLSVCPHCDARTSRRLGKRLVRGMIVACTSVTLAACYGVAPDGGDFGDAGTDGPEPDDASYCAAEREIEPNGSFELLLEATSAFDRGVCSQGAGFGASVRFDAVQGVSYQFRVTAAFPVGLGVRVREGDSCEHEKGCVVASEKPGEDVGGAGGIGGQGGAGPGESYEARLTAFAEEGEELLLAVSGDPGVAEPRVRIRIDTDVTEP